MAVDVQTTTVTAPAAGAVRRALVVDDERVQRLIVAGTASKAGFIVDSAASVEEARALLAQHAFNVVVLDLSLRDNDGIELLRSLYTGGTDPVLVFMSGFDERVREASARLASALGLRVAGTLAKPLDLDRLVTLLGSLPERPHIAAPPNYADVTPDRIAAALTNGEIFCLYQPKISLRAGRMVGVEVLARWRTTSGDIIPPIAFIPVAEAAGLIERLTWVVLEQAGAALRDWHAIDPTLTMAVNFSPSSLNNLGMPASVIDLLDRYHLAPETVVVEVTESAVMADFVTAAEILTRLRIRGVKVSIDDFGTGHSSLLSLMRLPFSELKIDQSFVRSLLHDPESPKLVQAVLRMCEALGLSVVAEGVETQPVADALLALGCDVVQGYLFDRPLSYTDLTRRLAAQGTA